MRIANYTVHPAADLFPMMEGGEYDALVEDIRENGMRSPVVLFEVDGERVILDGRNRLRAAMDAGASPRFSEYEGNDPIAHVISLNLRRRHLDTSQRAMLAAELATLRNGQHGKLAINSQLTTPQAAKLLNVSTAAVKQAKAVKANATPEVVAAVRQGKTTVGRAAKAAKLPKDQQAKAIAEPRKRRTAKQDATTSRVDQVASDSIDDFDWELVRRMRAILEFAHSCKPHQRAQLANELRNRAIEIEGME